MSPFNEAGSVSVLEIDRAVFENSGLTILICDVWSGERDDPVTSIKRYVGMFRNNVDLGVIQLREHSYRDEYELVREEPLRDYGGNLRFESDGTTPKMQMKGLGKSDGVLLWDDVDTIKESDKSAERHRADQDRLSSPERSWGRDKQLAELYIKFMAAIDTLAKDDTDETAWKDVEAYRDFHAMQHEQ
jgi:hypothetical protein